MGSHHFLKKLLLILPALLLALDAIDYVASGILSSVAATVLIVIIIIFFLTIRPKKDATFYFILLFLAYTLIISVQSSNYKVTIPGYLSIFVSMSFYIVSYNIIKDYEDLKKFKKLVFLIPIIFIINLSVFTFFNIGDAVYGGILKVGNLHHNRIYTGSLVIMLSFVFFKHNNKKKRDSILITALLIIIILSYRRTAIILVLTCYLIYIYMSNKNQVFKYFLPVICLLTITYPVYNKPLFNVIEARGKRALFEKGLQSESRYLEMKIITERALKFTNIKYSLFGKEYLNSFGTYSTRIIKFPNTRILHTDYSVILHGAGIIGFILYISIVVVLIIKTIKFVRMIGIKNDISILLVSLLAILIIVTPSGSILNITFRTTFFILLGGAMRVADEILDQKWLLVKSSPRFLGT